MGYPTNQQCWDTAHGLGVDAIQVFSFAATYARLPSSPSDLLSWNQSVWTWAGNVGIDPVYGFGYAQIHGGLPTTREALQGYLNILGVRDPATGLLSHEQPGSPGGMIRPGPGDGYIGNVQPTDPGIAARPYTPPGTAVPAQTAAAVVSSSGTYIASQSAAASAAAPISGAAAGTAAAASSGAGAVYGIPSATDAGAPGVLAQLDGGSRSTTTTTTSGGGQLSSVLKTLEQNPVLALVGIGGAYLLLFGVPSHRR